MEALCLIFEKRKFVRCCPSWKQAVLCETFFAANWRFLCVFPEKWNKNGKYQKIPIAPCARQTKMI